MSTAILVSLLLLGSPDQSVQDSVSAQRVEKLENRIEALNSKIEAQQEYLSWTIFGERTAYAAFLTLIVALFGAVGYGVFRWRISQVKEEVKNYAKKEVGELSDTTKKLRERISVVQEKLKDINDRLIESELYRIKADMRSDLDDEIYISQALSFIEKIYDKESLDLLDTLNQREMINNIEQRLDNIKDEKEGIPKNIHDIAISKIDGIIDKSENEEITGSMYSLRDKIAGFEILKNGYSE